MTKGVYNVTIGIKDPNVFTPPADCQPGKVVSFIPSRLFNIN